MLRACPSYFEGERKKEKIQDANRGAYVRFSSSQRKAVVISFLDLEAHAVHVHLYLPGTYLDICSSKSVHFRRSRKENQENKEKTSRPLSLLARDSF